MTTGRPPATLALTLFAAIGCAGATQYSPARQGPPATQCAPGARCAGAPTAAAPARAISLRLRVPESFPARGTVIVRPWTHREVLAGRPAALDALTEAMDRMLVVRGASGSAREIAVELAVPADTARVEVALDPETRGLEGYFAFYDPRRGVATGAVDLPAESSAPVAVELAGRPDDPAHEPCAGERDELVVIDAPERRREGDDRDRLSLCVHRPPSYDASPQRRYPVVFTFSGFGGGHAEGSAWSSRTIFDRLAGELGREVLIVSVETRVPEGSTYLQRSERFGDWETLVADRVVREIDARFRTLPQRATLGHSTGGWNALSIALRRPDVFSVACASSPDALDLDRWMLTDDRRAVRAEWVSWIRGEARLGGGGQFVSYAAAWSPDGSALGFAWPIDLETGALRRDVYDAWRRASPSAALETADGLARARRLSGRIAITSGRRDEFGIFEPAETFVTRAREAGVEIEWTPTDLGHFGELEPRFLPLVRFALAHLGTT
jgi:S-formylglutathione hydrolase FrmB